MKLPPQITWLQYALANAAIVILIPFLAIQGMPPIDWAWSWAAPLVKKQPIEEVIPPPEEEIPPVPTPVADWLATKISPVANLTGISPAPWKMFAPEPDPKNHRLRARIEYRDGTVIQWRSPEWPELSCWQRFWSSRELEYIDRIAYFGTPQRRNAFADYLAVQNRKNPQPEGAPKRVTFVKEEAIIPNPHIAGWVPMAQPLARAREDVLSPKRVYPVPLELLKKERAAPAGQASHD
jgi:hypothetical protein